MRGTRTRRWRELCIKASQIEPERRMAVVAELVSLLRENAYRFGPLLVDVTIKRWQVVSGLHAIHAETRLSFEAAAAERIAATASSVVGT